MLVKKQTLILVVIGVILFIAGSAIAFASVEGASKHAATNSVTGVASEASVVVAKANIPAGTTGQSMVSNGLVALQPIASKDVTATDLGSLAGLTNQVLTQAVVKGHAITSDQLTASSSSLSVPTGLNAVTVMLTGTNGLAGYLQPGARVDVYANVTKISLNSPASANLPLPCTELAMANIEVLDVESTVPAYAGHRSSGRAVPTAETLLLAVDPGQARSIEFLSQNESISVVQTQQDVNPPPLQQCIGTDQTTAHP
jgi:Flp pilus assembly protein CpaB